MPIAIWKSRVPGNIECGDSLDKHYKKSSKMQGLEPKKEGRKITGRTRH